MRARVHAWSAVIADRRMHETAGKGGTVHILRLKQRSQTPRGYQHVKLRNSARSINLMPPRPLPIPGERLSYPACDKLQYARFACKCRARARAGTKIFFYRPICRLQLKYELREIRPRRKNPFGDTLILSRT